MQEPLIRFYLFYLTKLPIVDSEDLEDLNPASLFSCQYSRSPGLSP